MKIRLFLALMVALCALRNPTQAATLPNPLPERSELPEALRKASSGFHNLSQAERQSKLREARHQLRNYRKQKRQHPNEVDDRTVLLAILAILLPPLAVYLKETEITGRFWISILLSLLFWVPGVFYAFLVIFEVI